MTTLRSILSQFEDEIKPAHKGERIIIECLMEGEPYVVFRGKDIFSPMVITHYLKLIEEYAPNDHEFQESLIDLREHLKNWQRANVGRVRYPD